MLKHTPFMPIAVPEQIIMGQYKGQYSCRYRDEHGLVQTHFPFVNSQIAWAFTLSLWARNSKAGLEVVPISTLSVGDLILNADYQLLQVTKAAAEHKNIFNEHLYSAVGVFAKDLPKTPIEVLIRSAYKLPITNEDFVV